MVQDRSPSRPIPDAADPAAMLGDLVTGAALNYPRWSDAAFDRAVAAGHWDRAEAALRDGAPARLAGAAAQPASVPSK